MLYALYAGRVYFCVYKNMNCEGKYTEVYSLRLEWGFCVVYSNIQQHTHKHTHKHTATYTATYAKTYVKLDQHTATYTATYTETYIILDQHTATYTATYAKTYINLDQHTATHIQTHDVGCETHFCIKKYGKKLPTPTPHPPPPASARRGSLRLPSAVLPLPPRDAAHVRPPSAVLSASQSAAKNINQR